MTGLLNRDKPAFPSSMREGMSLRDYFASKVMQSVISGTEIDLTPEYIAKTAYAVADAMLKERG